MKGSSSMIITPKNNFEPNREYAFRMVKDNIINMEIKPGSLIGEQEIASQLGISRTPVHEAFLELSKSRILNILPQKGCSVSLIDYELIKESRFLRIAVETALIREACDVATDEEIQNLYANIKLQQFYLENDPPKFMDLDNEFHKSIYVACNKLQCFYMVSLMSLHFDRVRSLSLRTIKDNKLVSDHIAIADAIAARDKDAACAAFSKHMSRFDLDWDIIKKEYSEYITE